MTRGQLGPVSVLCYKMDLKLKIHKKEKIDQFLSLSTKKFNSCQVQVDTARTFTINN